MPLYKYLLPDRVDILELEHIRYTQPALLNDPFEMRPHFRDLFSERDLVRMFRGQAAKTIVKELHAKLPRGTRILGIVLAFVMLALFWRRLMDMMRTIVDTLSSKFRQDFEQIVEVKLRHAIGVLSLTRRNDNLLMWAHYADQHRGFILAVDEKHPVFSQRRSDNDEFNHLREVEYSDQKQKAELKLMTGTDLLLRKSTEWAHEEEWRILKPLDSTSAIALKPADHSVHLFALPPDAIQGVIYGAHMAEEHKERIRAVLFAKPEYDHVWQKQAEVASERFGLNFFELPGALKECAVPAAKIFSHDIAGDLREDLVQMITDVISATAKQPLDLSRLRSIHIAEDLQKLIASNVGIDNGPVDAHVLAFGAGSECDVDMYLATSNFERWSGANNDKRDAMIHFLHREMAHVHNVTVRYRALGEKTLTVTAAGKEGYLGPVAMKIWNDYAVARLSASSLPYVVRRQYGKKVGDNWAPCQIAVGSAIKAYRKHRNLRELMAVVMEQLAIYLGTIAEGCGYADGGDPTLKDVTVDLVMAAAGKEYGPIAKDMLFALRRMYRYYPAWRDFTIYDGLMFAARHLAFRWGISLRDKGKGVHIAVP